MMTKFKQELARVFDDNLQQSFKLCPDATLKGNIAAWNRIRTIFAQKGYLEGVNFQCPQNSKI